MDINNGICVKSQIVKKIRIKHTVVDLILNDPFQVEIIFFSLIRVSGLIWRRCSACFCCTVVVVVVVVVFKPIL